MTYRVTLLDGKYTVEHTNGTNFKAYHYGSSEVWRDLTGDGLVLALVQKIEELDFQLRCLHENFFSCGDLDD